MSHLDWSIWQDIVCLGISNLNNCGSRESSVEYMICHVASSGLLLGKFWGGDEADL
jgi:hypothetical protein